MEGYKHFSHRHNLNHYQIPEGTLMTCSGCNSTAIGTVYACWKCNFFLHGNCYLAKRSLQHPSHPSHPLTLVQSPTYPSSSFYCKACTLIGTGFSYCCSHCEFDLHVDCAYNNPSQQNLSLPNQSSNLIHNNPMPNQFQTTNASTNAYIPYQAESSNSKIETRGEILHKSHPNHPLKLIIRPPGYNEFTCNACEGYGTSSTYHCATCKFSLHDKCASMTEIVKREDHLHPLQLIFSCPILAEGNHFQCDVCYSVVPKDSWVYYCNRCDFGCHAKCVNSKALDREGLANQLAENINSAARIEQSDLQAAFSLYHASKFSESTYYSWV